MPPRIGLLDLPAPLFAWIDAMLAQALPPLGRLALWAVAAAGVSMALYRVLSPQARFALLKEESAAARAALAGYEGPLAGLWPYVGRALAPAGTQLRLALGPALLASLPVLVLMVWLGAHYGHGLPAPGESVTVEALRGTEAVVSRTVAWPGAGATLALRDPSGREVLVLPVDTPVAAIDKWRWWNALVGNPAGYLAPDASVDRVTLDLRAASYLTIGPAWLRGWEAVFLTCLVLASVALKAAFRIA
jgi:hypothetical protein